MFENGFVLLKDTTFDTKQLINDLKTDWDITTSKTDVQKDSIAFSADGVLCSITVMLYPIPDGEAEKYAQGNYYCSDAVNIAQNHQAHIVVTVMNESLQSTVDCMKRYSKIIACCLKQDSATGVYTSGTVFSAAFYRKKCQKYLQKNGIAVMIWVFIRLGKTENGNQLYTIGMEKFQKQEMEILNNDSPIKALLSTLIGMCGHIITTDVTLNNGGSFSFNDQKKWSIRLSDSVYAKPEQSIKLYIDNKKNSRSLKVPKKSRLKYSENMNNSKDNAVIKESLTSKKNVLKCRPMRKVSKRILMSIIALLIIVIMIILTSYFYYKQDIQNTTVTSNLDNITNTTTNHQLLLSSKNSIEALKLSIDENEQSDNIMQEHQIEAMQSFEQGIDKARLLQKKDKKKLCQSISVEKENYNSYCLDIK